MFEEQVIDLLIKLGYSVVPQVGVSGFRIDIGVQDEKHPGRYLLGIECDGAKYHSSPVARDRDRLRQCRHSAHRTRAPKSNGPRNKL